jgi:hypothetical protein
MPRTYLQKDRCKFSIGVLSIKLNLKFYYENLINNKLSILDQKSKLYLFSNLKQNLSVESYLSISNFEYTKLIMKGLIYESFSDSDKLLKI